MASGGDGEPAASRRRADGGRAARTTERRLGHHAIGFHAKMRACSCAGGVTLTARYLYTRGVHAPCTRSSRVQASCSEWQCGSGSHALCLAPLRPVARIRQRDVKQRGVRQREVAWQPIGDPSWREAMAGAAWARDARACRGGRRDGQSRLSAARSGRRSQGVRRRGRQGRQWLRRLGQRGQQPSPHLLIISHIRVQVDEHVSRCEQPHAAACVRTLGRSGGPRISREPPSLPSRRC